MVTKVLISDDHLSVLDALSIGLAEHDIEVAGATAQPDEVVPMYRRVRPDVVVLDISFHEDRDDRGMAIAQSLLAEFPEARVVFCSQFTKDELIRRGYALKAAAYLPKATPLATVAEAIHAARRGETYILPSIAQKIALSALGGSDVPASPFESLDERELQVITLVARGWTNAEICEELGLSGKTISMAAQSAKGKLGVSRQADITRLAIHHGLIPSELEPGTHGTA